MPRQNTCPADFPPFILSQIEQVAQQIVATRKARGETQAQWAQRLGISQPTMARLERGDPAIATATYVMCLWLVNPQLDLRQLLPSALPAMPPAQATTAPAPAQAPSPSAADELADLLASWNTPAL
ncbi:helix-turn-helix domain-containing protein [Comamonas aquatica]|jgi:transcriptional regulator with XRE-family HTH domain|uniref:Helix-turn-helix domain-containing protein n=1 Tax=Comamonas aquatica TaxID=225991 RepID=A0AA42W106_9BURK|nr:helix-turn-helix transcriptional regulator [Comamonas aquatica]MDH1429284.1 helix-turn-helix domain-containing protein [Comamonas aquatica]MDH1604822.1 helix-turn-helix domain-containing protein [Comamonas aquatica]MDH1617059.1 helix-turn-helix domain-containing protein [Comamonas aquatica]MDH2004680.1 helix-turn-helix domain-containing protein [Comamonas aquatica]